MKFRWLDKKKWKVSTFDRGNSQQWENARTRFMVPYKQDIFISEYDDSPYMPMLYRWDITVYINFHFISHTLYESYFCFSLLLSVGCENFQRWQSLMVLPPSSWAISSLATQYTIRWRQFRLILTKLHRYKFMNWQVNLQTVQVLTSKHSFFKCRSCDIVIER